MATPNTPQGSSSGRGSEGGIQDRSRLERVLVKSSVWKQKTLRDIEYNRELAKSESSDSETQASRLIHRLSAQLDERNDEIERLRQHLSRLKDEMSKQGEVHQREIEFSQAELERVQDAYDQFEKESDSLLSELTRQNERLRDECRHDNVRSLLKK